MKFNIRITNPVKLTDTSSFILIDHLTQNYKCCSYFGNKNVSFYYKHVYLCATPYHYFLNEIMLIRL